MWGLGKGLSQVNDDPGHVPRRRGRGCNVALSFTPGFVGVPVARHVNPGSPAVLGIVGNSGLTGGRPVQKFAPPYEWASGVDDP